MGKLNKLTITKMSQATDLKIADYPITKITPDSRDWPRELNQLKDPPRQLYFRGQISSDLFKNTLAIVGSRKMTSYGERVLDQFIPSLVAAGITTISGFMYGIDTQVHQQTLECGGKTVAVLGGGLNVLYPPENERLYLDIISPKQSHPNEYPHLNPNPSSKGIMLSEYPPNQQPQLWTFPQRNQIVAALSTLGVLVIEAGEKSGSLITAKIAMKLNKPVFAIPGPITSSVSTGTNQLIKEGLAKMVINANDIVGAHHDAPETKQIETTRAIRESPLQNTEHQILQLLSLEPLTIDEIARKLNLDIVTLNQTITMMSLNGRIKEERGKYYLDK